ncbi:formylglycine-generating enzyme family protein [Neptunicella sp. SCSIO 80796]|uniref:formylglycine-generating enzyme family protein n=1 Tax=Neptunicella plasticusilytica TaxID=3117012 RepID=UPI003A4E466B
MTSKDYRIPAPRPKIAEFEQPHTLPIHLPTPGETPPWPFHTIGQWKVDVNGSVEAWRHGFKIWRREHLIRMGYDDSQYRRQELQWSQSNYVHTQMMVEDRFFYDPVLRQYTVDKYLDDLEVRFGGIDSVLLWYIYPNIGIDDRSQHDLVNSLPGGVEGLKQVVSDFHRRNVRVFLPTMPWDNGTRDNGKTDWQALTELAAEVNADGINGDTYFSVPRAFRDASDQIGHPVVLQPETWPLSDEALMWNNQSWGKASTSVVPAVSKLKWLEPRHLTNVENRWARNRTDDFHYIFFNGHGYNAWENIWGIWNQLTPRDAETLRRIATIFRQFSQLLVSPDWQPYFATLQQGVFATCFPKEYLSLWTIVNRNEYEITGEQLVINHHAGTGYFDLWNGVELQPRFDSDNAVLSFNMESKGYGCVLAIKEGGCVEDLANFLQHMKKLTAIPLQDYSGAWKALPQEMVEIELTEPVKDAPDGMIAIPSGQFDFKVGGIEIEGYMWAGLDFQYPWESLPRRAHYHHMKISSFFIDKYPVTNTDYYQFILATGYYPDDDHNFLKDWVDGRPRKGWENKPVTWVSIEDARAYASWANKRLPNEWEWQYAAQGDDGRLFPWGNSWDAEAVPEINTRRHLVAPDDVDAHPNGASPFGVMDMVGNIWQWTNEFIDKHTRAASLRGGSSYQPATSHWYFPQAYQLDQHGKYLLMAPCKDRSGMLGFRCIVDRITG